MTNPTDELANDIRAVDGNHDLGAGELAEALTALGYRKVQDEESALPLSAYASGDYVTVMGRDMEWVPGRVSAISQLGGNIHVDTEKGPVTIASKTRIKKQDTPK